MPRREMERAKQAAAWAEIKHVPVHSNPLENPEIKSNTEMRCYHCKKALFSQVAIKARKAGLRYVIDGTNSDDDPAQRPGMKALAELGVISPLREAGISKARVREIARVLGLPSWDTPTYSCLATKVQKNKPITIEQIKLAESAEEALISLGMEGFKVRLQEDGIRVETTGETLLNNREEAGRILKKLGFADIDLI